MSDPTAKFDITLRGVAPLDEVVFAVRGELEGLAEHMDEPGRWVALIESLDDDGGRVHRCKVQHLGPRSVVETASVNTDLFEAIENACAALRRALQPDGDAWASRLPFRPGQGAEDTAPTFA